MFVLFQDDRVAFISQKLVLRLIRQLNLFEIIKPN